MSTQEKTLRRPEDFNPVSSEVLQCPYPFLETLQEQAPIYKVPGADYFIVSRYDDVQTIFKNPEVYSNDFLKHFKGRSAVFVPEPVLNHSDPPVHGRTKPIGVRAFGPGQVKALHAFIQGVVDRLIDGFIDTGEVELNKEFAAPLPLTVIADQLGLPADHIWKLKLWSEQMPIFSSAASSEADRKRAAEILAEGNAFLMEKFHEKRKNPTDDVISTLAAATTESDPDDPDAKPRLLTEGEALGMMQLFLVGGNDTTTNALLNGILLLMRNPGAIEAIKSGQRSWPQAVEEFLRLEGSVRGLWRVTTCDTELSGTRITAGTTVFISLAAANRDPRKFPDPEALDLHRDNISGHLAFGHGIHLCVGFRLARKELEIAFETLFRRLDNIRLTPGKNDFDDLYLPSTMVRAMKALHLSFDKAG
jgi:cytochrome P450